MSEPIWFSSVNQPEWFGAFCCADDDELTQMGSPSPKEEVYDPIPIEHEAAYVSLWMQMCRERDYREFERKFR